MNNNILTSSTEGYLLSSEGLKGSYLAFLPIVFNTTFFLPSLKAKSYV